MSLLSQSFADTAYGFVLTAAVVCTTMAATVVILMRHAEAGAGRQRAGWASLVASVAGAGVWTTHFVAILGYRPDALLGYSVETTSLSALAGFVFVGGPLAAACYTRSRGARAALGGLSGAGVGAMHFTGMLALEGCRIGYDLGAVVLSLGFGMMSFAAALGAPVQPLLRAGLLVLGVCALHFTAMAGVSLEVIPNASGRNFDAKLLSAAVALASLALSVIAVFAIATTRRLDEERRRAAEGEDRRNRILSLAMRNMSNGLVMVDASGGIIAFNERALELNHLAPGELAEGQHFEEFLAIVGARNDWDADLLRRVVANHHAWMATDEITQIEHKFDNGRVLGVACRPMAEGGAVFTYDDLTARRSAEAIVAEMTYTDALTGLPNRRSFRETIAAELEARALGMVLLLDLDRFKMVNETMGHLVGDRLLSQVAQRLGGLAPAGRLFRVDGDGLAVLLNPDLGPEEGRAFAERLIAAFGKPFGVNGDSISIGCSVGLACVEAGDDADRLMQKADLALYRAKGLGRNRVETYEAGMVEQAKERLQLELDLARAVEEGQLFLQYQPLCGLPDRRLAGFEALVRWRHPDRGLIPPADFIPLAEENGRILEIGAWILDEACRQAARWPEEIHVAVNISVVQMRSPEIVGQIARALERHGLDPGRLELEVTETAMVEDGQCIAETLRDLRRLGVRVAMDDFGTGYSSLAHLRQFEIDRIKIDRSFVKVADQDAEARAVVRAMTSMAREMSLVTTGEGVGTIEQLELLIELGCDTAQGFFIGRPVDADEADRLVAIQRFDDDAQADASAWRADLRDVGT